VPVESEEARKAKFQGTVVLEIVIDERGNPTNFKILNPLGLGLDEKAVEAARQWRFRLLEPRDAAGSLWGRRPRLRGTSMSRPAPFMCDSVLILRSIHR
jgi:TonB family protein